MTNAIIRSGDQPVQHGPDQPVNRGREVFDTTSVSGVHSIKKPTLGGSSHSKLNLAVELERLQSLLRQRELEVDQLKRQVVAMEASVASAVQQSAALEPCTPPAGRPEGVVAELAYPMLQNVALACRPSSLPPASMVDATPVSERRTPRRSCEIELEFTEDTNFYAGLTQDISQGGVFIATYHLRPIGTRLELAFELPDGAKVKTSGEVKWLREDAVSQARPGMGIAFTNLPDDLLESIARFCRDRPPLYMEL